MKAQSAQILNYLKAGYSLTPLDALHMFGSFRLGARVYDLRKEGHDIKKRMIETESGKRIAEYWI